MSISDISELEFAEFVDFEDWDTTAEANASCLCIHGESEETSNELNFAGTSSPVDLEPTSENCQPCCEKQTNARKRSFKQTESPQQCLCQKQYKVSRPRIVRRDYRRDFPMLWVHVMNTGSYDFMMEHIRTYYSPDMVLRQRDLRAVDVAPAYPESKKMKGLSEFSEFWYTAMHLLPDLVCRLKHSVLKIRSDGTSTVLCSFILNGTKLVRLNGTNELDNIQRHAQGLVVDNMDEASMDSAAIDATVAAVAAVAPTKGREALRAHQADLEKADLEKTDLQNQFFSKSAPKNASKNAFASAQKAHTNTFGATSSNEQVSASTFAAASAATRAKLLKSRTAGTTTTNSVSSTSTTTSATATTTGAGIHTKGLSSVRADLTKLTSQVHIPYSILRKMNPEDDNFKSLRFDNNAQLNFGMAFTAYAIATDGSGVESVVLAGEINLFCSLAVNFNADFKVESVVLNYIT